MAENQMQVQDWIDPEPWVEVFSPRNQPLHQQATSLVGVPSEASVDESYLAALEARDPAVRAVARWFRTDHLPTEALHADVGREFQIFALRLLEMIGDDSDEMEVALRKLLEAKDAAVRAALS